MTTLISRLLRPLLNRALTAPILLLLAASAAFAINAPDEEVKVRKLTAEEILEITVNKTWVVDFDNMALTATTFYKDTGERFTERQGDVE
ncbi:hypothetical protein N9L14_02835, partial [Alphaproteobacteria bacterium]|nr:hypothetical protein [Alphaproteobacteria bacterium]